ncbi:MAG: DNA primase small subunit domain-containing protein [Candidatus Hecatellaceae archaeon]
MGEAELAFLQENFRRYYMEEAARFKPPPSLEKREFGFIPFKTEKAMLRHKGFKSREELARFLAYFTPSDAYYSSAYYENPSVEDMAGKGWLGADLIFDIDSDHLPTSCKAAHDKWRCLDCGLEGRGLEPDNCPRCGSRRIDADKWVCSQCLEAAKRETLKLASILEEDFGFPQESIEVAFSGHRGYHIHVSHESVLRLSSEERKEIVDYVSAVGLEPSILFPELRKGEGFEADFMAEGWKGRLARAVYSLLLKPSHELRSLGLPERTLKFLEEHREELLELLPAGKTFKVSRRIWEKLLKASAKLEAALVDTVVTADVHRLIRLPGSLHGKTGLKVCAISLERLPEFDPLVEAVAFKGGRVKVKVVKPKPLKLGGEEYRFEAGELVELPRAVAIYMVGTGLAVLPGG